MKSVKADGAKGLHHPALSIGQSFFFVRRADIQGRTAVQSDDKSRMS
jgi:hypothetical protein